MRKNVTMNALKEGITSNAARNGDTASLVNLATTSSMEKQRLSHVSIGYVTMRNLPMVQTILLGIAIGIFPLLVLAAVFNKLTLSVLKGYVFALMWLQTWPLLYAILNSAMVFYAKQNGAPVVLSELSQIQLKYSDLASTAGYLSAMIPPLSWMMVKVWALDFPAFTATLRLRLSARRPVRLPAWWTAIIPTATCRRRTSTASAGVPTVPRHLAR